MKGLDKRHNVEEYTGKTKPKGKNKCRENKKREG
jgi:hypothetical protein